MAFCGAEFEEKSVVDHSLKNVVAFSTSKGQMSMTSSEGLYQQDEKGETLDRRVKIEFNEEKYFRRSYWWVCQITFKLPREKAAAKKAVGSASLIKPAKGGLRALSCAHNFISVSLKDDSKIKFDEHSLYVARYGAENWRRRYELKDENVIIHPKYDGSPSCGFDIALCSLSQDLGPQNVDKEVYIAKAEDRWFRDNCYAPVEPNDIKKGMAIEISGYPGEKEGYPYTHTGEITDVTKTKLGGHVLWYSLDTTPGNSGSAIMITDESFRKEKGMLKYDKVIVGIHNGGDLASGMNFGTLITGPIYNWVHNGKSESDERASGRRSFLSFSKA